jgi:3-dehydroquinate synthase
MPTIHIELEDKSYDILIGSDIRKEIQKTLQQLEYKKQSIAIITDQNIEKNYKGLLDETFSITPRFVLTPGEANKSMGKLEECHEFLINSHIERTSAIFAIGGGVVGDLAGFAAASYMRGIDYYQIPTSLLAMVDSSIGGKTSVNLKSGKNLVGAFYQPKGVFIDTDFLKTLPSQEFTSGMAEVIKHALLGDKNLFELLETSPVLTAKSPEITALIEKSCQIKANIVKQDEKDKNGKRALLNLGHTFGHAIEQSTDYKEYLHGEAVSIGLVMAARLSELLGYIDEKQFMRIKSLIEKYGLPTKLKKSVNIAKLNKAIHRDKKTEAGFPHFIVLNKIGEAHEDKKVSEKLLHVLWLEIGAED